MGLTIAKLAAETRSFTWKYLGEDIAVTYRPGVLTQTWLDGTAAHAMAAAVVSVDITNGSNKPIKLDEKSLSATLPWPFMRKLNTAIYEDATVDPTTAETSAGS